MSSSIGMMKFPIFLEKQIVMFQSPATSYWDHFPYTLVMTNIAMENHHRNSGFSHFKDYFTIETVDFPVAMENHHGKIKHVPVTTNPY